MISQSWLFRASVLILITSILGCGGSGGGATPSSTDLWSPATGATPASGNFVYLESESRDFIGRGGTYTYTQATASLSVNASGGLLSVTVNGNENWTGHFQMKETASRLQKGTYKGLERYPFHDPATGGLSWTGEGRGCDAIAGWFVVDSVTYLNGTLTAVDLRFEQRCEGATPALHGQIHWNLADPTAPPGPEPSPPPNLWAPAAGTTPASGNYVYLESESGDPIGRGQTLTYTQATASLSVNASDGRFSVTVNGDENWNGNFQTMETLARLEEGYYGGLERYPFHNPALGGLDWSGEGRGCANLQGWFNIDGVTYTDGVLTAIDLRFEQRCTDVTAAVHGQIHWVLGDPITPPGPVNPVPDDLWKPAAGATPSSGNYVYLESESGDSIGQGNTYTYTQATASLWFNESNGLFSVNVNGNENWTGRFRTMEALTQIQEGFYGSLEGYPGNNPVRGGLGWDGSGWTCNALQGWFAVDSVTYTDGVLTAIDLRFEQHCNGAVPALHGKIHLAPNDSTVPSGPINPIPSDLWTPAAGTTPTSGSYVYLESESGDFIGQGQTFTYTPATTSLSVSASGGLLSVLVTIGDGDVGTGWFQTMETISQLQEGYYGGLGGYPFHNPALGGLNWLGDGRACNTLQGWFTVDSVTYVGGVLTAIDLRFEQHCEGATPALHGQIHWTGP